ncbi:MAG: site-specific DNA-methyltransferase [Archaeoglobaceae archaeon]
MKKLPNNCIHLMVTSPPYNVGKEYDKDLTLGEYLVFIEEVMKEVYRVLVWGGRVCFNVANLGRKPYIPLHAYLIQRFEEIGYLFRGEIIWDKGDFKRCKGEKRDTITRDEFLEFTKSIWRFQPESAKKVGHPAPFPVDLPYRCIRLFTFEGDEILDPFAGSGTSCVADLKTHRHFIGIELEDKYVKIAVERIREILSTKTLLEF